jgi:hypothetical protein
MQTTFVVLSEKHEGFAFPTSFSGITPVTYTTHDQAQRFGLSGCPSEWVEPVTLMPNGALKRSNGELFTHDSIGRSFLK